MLQGCDVLLCEQHMILWQQHVAEKFPCIALSSRVLLIDSLEQATQNVVSSPRCSAVDY